MRGTVTRQVEHVVRQSCRDEGSFGMEGLKEGRLALLFTKKMIGGAGDVGLSEKLEVCLDGTRVSGVTLQWCLFSTLQVISRALHLALVIMLEKGH